MYDNEKLNGDMINLILSYLHRFTTKSKKLIYNINKLLHCKKYEPQVKCVLRIFVLKENLQSKKPAFICRLQVICIYYSHCYRLVSFIIIIITL